jgi:hypothetical protein
LEGLDWINVTQGREGRRTLLETLVKFRFPQKAAIFWLPEGQSVSEVGRCCMESVAHRLLQSVREMANGIQSPSETLLFDSLGLQTASNNQTPYYATQNPSAGHAE